MSFYTAEFDAASFWARGSVAAGVRGRALANSQIKANGEAVSISPLSDIRECLVYFDSDEQGIPLHSGRVIRRRFSTVMFAPIMPSTFVSSAITLTEGSTPLPLMARQVLRIDVWSGANIPGAVHRIGTLDVVQEKLTVSLFGGGATEYPILWVHAPGLHTVTAWASNDNNGNAAANDIKVYAVRPQVGSVAALSTAPRFGRQLGTITLPFAADGYKRYELVTVDPGASEYVMTVTNSLTDAINVRVGFEGVYEQ